MTNWNRIDWEHQSKRNAHIDMLAARQATRDAVFAVTAELATHHGFTLSREIQTGNIYRECNTCGSTAEFSGIHMVDFTPCGRCAQNAVQIGTIPFCGELDADDADDSIPACYGL